MLIASSLIPWDFCIKAPQSGLVEQRKLTLSQAGDLQCDIQMSIEVWLCAFSSSHAATVLDTP